jgi:hypothetical protein
LLCPFLSPSASRISASSPTSICGGTFSAWRRKEVRRIQGSWGSLLEPTWQNEGRIPQCTPQLIHKRLVQKWFYGQQEQEPFVACDIAQIPEL